MFPVPGPQDKSCRKLLPLSCEAEPAGTRGEWMVLLGAPCFSGAGEARAVAARQGGVPALRVLYSLYCSENDADLRKHSLSLARK